MRIFDKDIDAIVTGTECGGSCGVCAECFHKASMIIACYVMDKFGGSPGESDISDMQRRYLKNQVIHLMRILGIRDETETPHGDAPSGQSVRRAV